MIQVPVPRFDLNKIWLKITSMFDFGLLPCKIWTKISYMNASKTRLSMLTWTFFVPSPVISIILHFRVWANSGGFKSVCLLSMSTLGPIGFVWHPVTRTMQRQHPAINVAPHRLFFSSCRYREASQTQICNTPPAVPSSPSAQRTVTWDVNTAQEIKSYSAHVI